MADKSKIEWLKGGATWNITSGCNIVSEGCENCWARRMAQRLKGRFGYPADNAFRVVGHQDKLFEPVTWKKPRYVFVSSMGDLFHEEIPDWYLYHVFEVIREASQHTFLILTKRPLRMATLEHMLGNQFGAWTWPKNVWAGVSIEKQYTWEDRINWLLRVPTTMRWVSLEPLLGPIQMEYDVKMDPDALFKNYPLNWVVCGAETGPDKRQMDLDWVRSIRDQCIEGDIPFFFKARIDPSSDKKISMPEIDGQIWDQMPTVD